MAQTVVGRAGLEVADVEQGPLVSAGDTDILQRDVDALTTGTSPFDTCTSINLTVAVITTNN